MYSRVTTFNLDISKREEAADIYNNSIIPAARKQEGFRSACFLVHKNAGKFVSITMWDSMEYAVANQKSGYFQAQIDKLAHLQVVIPEIEGFQVLAHEHNFD
ncbi:MAG: antibiotic biosynthesis monooxygenase [Bacteroidota bacterium]